MHKMLVARVEWMQGADRSLFLSPDFGLDTIIFNGHTTAADTLWSGLPLVSLSGVQMRSRAGASMSKALGVDTWLVRNLDDYEEVSVRLASDR